jgi:hypothetical protein
MEPLLKATDMLLAVFGTGKFLHECYEVLHHLFRVARRGWR